MVDCSSRVQDFDPLSRAVKAVWLNVLLHGGGRFDPSCKSKRRYETGNLITNVNPNSQQRDGYLLRGATFGLGQRSPYIFDNLAVAGCAGKNKVIGLFLLRSVDAMRCCAFGPNCVCSDQKHACMYMTPNTHPTTPKLIVHIP